MAVAKKNRSQTIRRSISITRELDNRVQRLARHQNWSANRTLESLVEAGLEAKEAEKRRFFELTERLRTATDVAEVEQIKAELARMTFGF